MVDTIRPADTADHALMVRMYEAMGMRTSTALRLHPSIRRICETDMMEENARELAKDETITFGSFEIKTFLLHLRD